MRRHIYVAAYRLPANKARVFPCLSFFCPGLIVQEKIQARCFAKRMIAIRFRTRFAASRIIIAIKVSHGMDRVTS